MPKQVGDYSYVDVIREYYNCVYPDSEETITANDDFYKKTHSLIRKLLRGFYSCANTITHNDKLPDVPLNFYQKEYLVTILKDYYKKTVITTNDYINKEKDKNKDDDINKEKDKNKDDDKPNVYKLCIKIKNGNFSAITSLEKMYFLEKAYDILSQNIPYEYNGSKTDRDEWQSLVNDWEEEIKDSIHALEAEKNFTKRFEKMWAKMYNECYSKEENENIVTYCEYGNRYSWLAPDSIFSVNHNGFGQFALLDTIDRNIILDDLEKRLSETLQNWKNDVEKRYIGPEIGLI